MVFSAVLLAKAFVPILSTPLGTVREASAQPSNVLLLISFSLLPWKVTSARFSQPLNASNEIKVRLAGKEMLVRFVQFSKVPQ